MRVVFYPLGSFNTAEDAIDLDVPEGVKPGDVVELLGTMWKVATVTKDLIGVR